MDKYQKIANIVYDISQFQIHNVFLLEKKRNMIMDGKFTKIIYSDELFILYGVFLNVCLLIDDISTNGISGNKYFFKFQPNHLINETIINEIIQIEYRILEFYKDTFNVNKKITTILRNQLYNGCIKIYTSLNILTSISHKDSSIDPVHLRPSHNLIENLQCSDKSSSGKLVLPIKTCNNIYPRKEYFLLKISGIWEDNDNIGLTYKFENINL